jgi:hypothetical protein
MVRPASVLPLLFCLCLITSLAGCGWGGIPPNPYLPIYTSPEIATGAWTIIGSPSSTGIATSSPIGGFAGGLTAEGTIVEGYFDIGSADSPGSVVPSTCFGSNSYADGGTTLFVRGTASNGSLILDGNFGSNDLHLTAQLSSDRRSIVSGSFIVTGSCSTNAQTLTGVWNPPVNGTYAGTANSNNGNVEQVTAQLVQGTVIYPFGGIPVDGNITFTGAGCTSTIQLRGAYQLGYLGSYQGYSAPGVANDADIETAQYGQANVLAFDNWGYSNPQCGSISGGQNSGTLILQ